MYAEAKGEYTKQLCQYMLPALQQYFLDMLEDAKQKEADSKKILLMFQQLFEGVPDWNTEKVQRETAALATATNCDYLEELLTAVFIAHTKVLSAIRLSSRQKKLHITIPKLDHFLHRTLIECARLMWSNTYLFSTNAPSMERQRNLRQIEMILHDGIQQAIRGMLPVKNILREYLREDDDEEEGEEDDKPEEKTAEGGEEKTAEGDKEKKVAEGDKEKPVDAAPSKNPSIVFTGLETTVENNSVEKFKEAPAPVDSDVEEIKILDGSPEPMDEFEDWDKKDEILQMDFEELK